MSNKSFVKRGIIFVGAAVGVLALSTTFFNFNKVEEVKAVEPKALMETLQEAQPFTVDISKEMDKQTEAAKVAQESMEQKVEEVTALVEEAKSTNATAVEKAVYSIDIAEGVTTTVYGETESYFYNDLHLFDIIVGEELNESLLPIYLDNGKFVQVAYGEGSDTISLEETVKIQKMIDEMIASIK